MFSRAGVATNGDFQTETNCERLINGKESSFKAKERKLNHFCTLNSMYCRCVMSVNTRVFCFPSVDTVLIMIVLTAALLINHGHHHCHYHQLMI